MPALARKGVNGKLVPASFCPQRVSLQAIGPLPQGFRKGASLCKVWAFQRAASAVKMK